VCFHHALSHAPPLSALNLVHDSRGNTPCVTYALTEKTTHTYTRARVRQAVGQQQCRKLVAAVCSDECQGCVVVDGCVGVWLRQGKRQGGDRGRGRWELCVGEQLPRWCWRLRRARPSACRVPVLHAPHAPRRHRAACTRRYGGGMCAARAMCTLCQGCNGRPAQVAAGRPDLALSVANRKQLQHAQAMRQCTQASGVGCSCCT
jgi:hypothetical protein